MTLIKYLDAVRGILNHLQNTQIENIEKAADLVIESLTNGGVIWCYCIGHGNEHDFIARAGGLAAVKVFCWNTTINSDLPECYSNRPRNDNFEPDIETIRFALRSGNVRPGDVMFMGSVSGRNINPVEMAIACNDMGVRVVGLTSLQYTSRVTSLHPSGKKLCDVVDVVLDNGAPYGDAAVKIEGYDDDLLPVSGVSMLTIGWMVWGCVMEKMAVKGDKPTVFSSVNSENGWEKYQKCLADYNRRGY